MWFWDGVRARVNVAAKKVVYAEGLVASVEATVLAIIVCTAIVVGVCVLAAFTNELVPQQDCSPTFPENSSVDSSYDSLICLLDFLYADKNDDCCGRYLREEGMIKARRTKSCLTTIEKCYENRREKLTPLLQKECQNCAERLNEGCECTKNFSDCKNETTQPSSKYTETKKKCCEYCLKFFKLDRENEFGPWYCRDWRRCPNDFVFYRRYYTLCCERHFSKDELVKSEEEHSCSKDSASCVGRARYGSREHEKRCVDCTIMLGAACDCLGNHNHCHKKIPREVKQTKTEVCCKYCLHNFAVNRKYVCSDIVCSCEEHSNKFQDLCQNCRETFFDMKCKPRTFFVRELELIRLYDREHYVSTRWSTWVISDLDPGRKIEFEVNTGFSKSDFDCVCELYNYGHQEDQCLTYCKLFRTALRWWMDIVVPRSRVRSRAVVTLSGVTLDKDSKEPTNASNSTASSISICLRLSIAHREQPSFQKCVDTCHEVFSRTRNSYSTMFNHSCKTERGINQAFCSWCWYNLRSDHCAESSKYHRTNYSSETTQLYVLILHSTHAFLTLLLFAVFCAKDNYSVICLSVLKVLIIFLCILSIGYAFGRFVFGPEHCLQMVEGFALSMGTIVAVLWLGEELEGGTRITRTAAVLA